MLRATNARSLHFVRFPLTYTRVMPAGPDPGGCGIDPAPFDSRRRGEQVGHGAAVARRTAQKGDIVRRTPHPTPPPLADVWAWQEQAACRDVNPDLFFAPEEERGMRRRA